MQALAKLEETWGRVAFVFSPHRSDDVHTAKMAEEDFEALEDNQVLVQASRARAAWGARWRLPGGAAALCCASKFGSGAQHSEGHGAAVGQSAARAGRQSQHAVLLAAQGLACLTS